MTAHQLVTGYVGARLDLPTGLDTTAAQAAGRRLPGGWTLHQPAPGAVTVTVDVSFGAAAVDTNADTVCLRLPHAEGASDTLAYVTYTAMEGLRQWHRKVTVHATAMIAPHGQAVLLLGSKGAGKTSTALALATRGWTHAGDDLVVLGETNDRGLTVWPGKPTAALRDPARPLAAKPQRVLEPFATRPAPLTWIVRLVVQPALATILTPAVPLSVNERLRLHEMLGRYISGLPTPVGGVAGAPYGPVWPLDTPALARWRSGLLTRLTGCRFDYLYAPDHATAADLLAREVDAG
jgi:hypothetical protein